MKFFTAVTVAAVALTSAVSAKESAAADYMLNQGADQIGANGAAALNEIASGIGKIKRSDSKAADYMLSQGVDQIGANGAAAINEIASGIGKIKRDIEGNFVVRDLFHQGRLQAFAARDNDALHARIAGLPNDKREMDVRAEYDSVLAARDALNAGDLVLMARSDDTAAHELMRRKSGISCAPPACGTPGGCVLMTPCIPTDSNGNWD